MYPTERLFRRNSAEILTASWSLGRPPSDIDDWVVFYVMMDNTRLVDRDMFMRYIGGGVQVGHCCSQADIHVEEDEEMEGISGDHCGGSCEGSEGVDDIMSGGPLRRYNEGEDSEAQDSDSEDSDENTSDAETDFDAEDNGLVGQPAYVVSR